MNKDQHSLRAEHVTSPVALVQTVEILAHEYREFLRDPIGRKPHFMGAVDAHARATTAANEQLIRARTKEWK